MAGAMHIGETSVRPSGTRLRLIESAERLFGERGIEAVSMREITAAASARNNSAAQYHFGTKDGLVRAIYALRSGPINHRRLYLLARAQTTADREPLRAFVEASVLPVVETIGRRPRSSWYARFLARVLLDYGGFWRLDGLDPQTTTGNRLIRECIEQQLPGLPSLILRQRLRFAETLAICTLAEFEQDRDAGHGWSGGIALVASSTIDAIVGILRAPLSAETEGLAHSTAGRAKRSASKGGRR